MFMRVFQALLLASTCAAFTLLCSTTVVAAQNKGHSSPIRVARVRSSKATTPSKQGQPGAAETDAASPPHPLDQADLEAFFDGIFRIQLERNDIAGATVLVTKDGRTLLEKGYGYSDWEKKTPVDPVTTGFRPASISKLFTWVAVMQLVEQHKLDLDTDVNSYLDFKIRPAFGKPITLRNLMTHTGGFEEHYRDMGFTNPKYRIPLRQYLVDNQPARIYPPGEVPAYSNYGVGLAGYIVEHISGQPFADYEREHIFMPLGMTHSSFEQPPPKGIVVSQGYRTTGKPAEGFEIVSLAPAGGLTSTAADMGRFAQALLNGGELDGQRVLRPETVAAMWTPQYRASSALPGACMGFYQVWCNNLRFIGHDGATTEFHSLFLIEPHERLVLFVSYNSLGGGQKGCSEILRGFADRYYPSQQEPKYLKLTPKQAREYAGTYTTTRRENSTVLALPFLMFRTEATVDKDGVLSSKTIKDFRGHVEKFRPVGKDLWQQVDGQQKLFFIRDTHGRIVRIAGGSPGTQLERVKWWQNRKVIFGMAELSLMTLLFVAMASAVRFFRRLVFRRRASWEPPPGTLRLSLGPRLAAWAWLVVVGFGIVFVFPLHKSVFPPTRAFDKYFLIGDFIAGTAVALSVWAVVSAIRIWFRDGRLITKVKYSLVGLACVLLSFIVLHWHVIGNPHRY